MIEIDAALLVALVFATVALLGASFFASCVIGTSQQISAFHHLLHLATTTLDGRFLVTRWTSAQMTFALTLMRRIWLTTF